MVRGVRQALCPLQRRARVCRCHSPTGQGLPATCLICRSPSSRDPHDPGRDITNIGHWSKGDVDVDLERASDTPYVIGLVRQAFEWQMDEVASG